MTTQLQRKQELHRLHESGCFVIPNPWDLGTARVLEQLGFRALATTSSGFAWSGARSDNASSLGQALAHFKEISEGVAVPVSADFQGCFAIDPLDVEKNVLAAAATGLAGLSIEDSTGDAVTPLFDFALSVERVHSARAATRQGDADPVLTARSEGFIVGAPDLDETIRRLTAYSEVGADCLYAPGLSTPDQITAVVQAVAPKPVNVLVGSDFTNVAALADLGVRRISVGEALARVAWGAFLAVAEEIIDHGTFRHLDDATPFGPLDRRFR
jgi:2-methylisocitrate lyase-like PEP mutase family enzyme